eukprot:6621427-Prymnesium_polylepis.2
MVASDYLDIYLPPWLMPTFSITKSQAVLVTMVPDLGAPPAGATRRRRRHPHAAAVPLLANLLCACCCRR